MSFQTGDLSRQIMWRRLTSVVEEQAQTLIRTSFSPTTREAGDLSAGVFTPDGRMIAQAVTGTPGHINSMARSVSHFIDAIPLADWREGDVALTNDPWQGTGHLNDLVVVTPVFRGGRVIAFFAATSHLVDIGGMGPGFDAKDVFHEGIRIPITKVVDAGRVDDKVLGILRANVRMPEQVTGDLMSLVAGNHTGGLRLLAMCEEFGLDGVEALSEFIFDRSMRGMREEIDRIPRGVYEAALTLDGIDRPVAMTATMTVADGRIDVEFGGDLRPSLRGNNVPFCYTEAYASYGVRCVVGRAVPNNWSSLSAVTIRAPEGSILNATDPAPVASRHLIGQMLPDLVFRCLAQAVPGRVPAEGAGTLWNIRLLRSAHGRGKAGFNALFFHSGGTGARPGLDGLNATAFPSGVRAIPIEISEKSAPVLYRRRELRRDSGGAGLTRGGLGQVIEVASRDGDPFWMAASYERTRNAPRGLDGGRDGEPGRVGLRSGLPFSPMGRQEVPGDDAIIVEPPGGAGRGDPFARDPARVRDDVENGFVSREAAAGEYGVMLTENLEVDEAATAALRSRPDRRTASN